jgi:hypothetical protein
MTELNEINILKKISERFNRYYKDIKELNEIIKNGLKTDDDFKKYYNKLNDIENKKDYFNVTYSINQYKDFKNLLTFSF